MGNREERKIFLSRLDLKQNRTWFLGELESGSSPGRGGARAERGERQPTVSGTAPHLREVKSATLNDAVSFSNAKRFGVKAESRAPLREGIVRWGCVWPQRGRAALQLRRALCLRAVRLGGKSINLLTKLLLQTGEQNPSDRTLVVLEGCGLLPLSPASVATSIARR